VERVDGLAEVEERESGGEQCGFGTSAGQEAHGGGQLCGRPVWPTTLHVIALEKGFSCKHSPLACVMGPDTLALVLAVMSVF
jgi:hypothetical protein